MHASGGRQCAAPHSLRLAPPELRLEFYQRCGLSAPRSGSSCLQALSQTPFFFTAPLIYCGYAGFNVARLVKNTIKAARLGSPLTASSPPLFQTNTRPLNQQLFALHASRGLHTSPLHSVFSSHFLSFSTSSLRCFSVSFSDPCDLMALQLPSKLKAFYRFDDD